MDYIKLRRSQIILASFAIFAMFVTAFPGVDLAISSLFFDGRTFLRDQWWQRLLQQGLGYFLPISVGVVALIYACNRLWKLNICCVDARRVVYVVLVLAIGCGFIVNFGLKDHFHRARPRDVVEFGGTKLFSPAFQVSNQCRTNCSFSSGDAAGAFFSMALALALSRRRHPHCAQHRQPLIPKGRPRFHSGTRNSTSCDLARKSSSVSAARRTRRS